VSDPGRLLGQVQRSAKRGCMGCAVVIGGPFLLFAALIVGLVVGGPETTEAIAEEGGVPGMACAPNGADERSVGRFGAEQMRNAATIVAVGKRMKIPERGQVIALMAAITESELRNLQHGDRDSLGLFQMRPTMGWGTAEQVTDPPYAARKFYSVLQDVPRWQQRDLGAAAQAVERSAFPDRYARNEQAARQVLGALRGTRCTTGGGSTGGSSDGVALPDNPRARAVIKAALKQVGVRYAWGGGTADGASEGFGVDEGVVGFDCSGLALYAYAKIGVAVPHQTQSIWSTFQPAITDRAALRPADLILLSSNGRPGGIHHVGIYLGNGRAVHAPQSGQRVKVDRDIWNSGYWDKEFIGAVRPGVR
jgi:cell wall-associated NlpC family hydrolase